jgi:SAM-dependent methyltransferase
MTHREKHARLFERIAAPYAWFFNGQTRSYAACFDLGRQALGDPAGKRALDIGCGTGAFTAALRAEGWAVQGVDVAPAMIREARKSGAPCSVADALEGLSHEDQSFDLVSAAYVAHGLRRDDRRKLYAEARRLSRGVVLFHDYNPRRRLLTSLVELVEGGDYFNFIKAIPEELGAVFSAVRIIPVGPQAAWYVCTP